jgi:hypothetical protein
MFDGHQCRAAPFTADGEPLHETEQSQQDGSGDADLGMRGQEADKDCRNTHADKRIDQHPFAPQAVTEVAENDAAQWACEEPDPEGRE